MHEFERYVPITKHTCILDIDAKLKFYKVNMFVRNTCMSLSEEYITGQYGDLICKLSRRLQFVM